MYLYTTCFDFKTKSHRQSSTSVLLINTIKECTSAWENCKDTILDHMKCCFLKQNFIIEHFPENEKHSFLSMDSPLSISFIDLRMKSRIMHL